MKRNMLDLSLLVNKNKNEIIDYLKPFNQMYNLSFNNGIYDIDSDMDELFYDSNIRFLNTLKHLNSITYDNGEIIDGCTEGQIIGYDVYRQNGIMDYVIPIKCMNNGCVLCDGLDLMNVKMYRR